jgi:hypothetical protein
MSSENRNKSNESRVALPVGLTTDRSKPTPGAIEINTPSLFHAPHARYQILFV